MGVKKMSLYQIGFQEVLMVVELIVKLLVELVLIGVQLEELEDFGGSLCDVVKVQIVLLLVIVMIWLVCWGVVLEICEGGSECINDSVLVMEFYEGECLLVDQVCCLGDVCFLNREVV